MVLADSSVRIREGNYEDEAGPLVEPTSLEGCRLKVAPGLAGHEEILSALMSKFLLVQTHYAGRNSTIDAKQAFFSGDHWEDAEEDEDEGEFRLVINYCRRVVLDFVGMLARAPVPRVPVPAAEDPGAPEIEAARKREYLLRLVWEDFLAAWRRAEMNAAKSSYGVVECLWRDDLSAEDVPIRGESRPVLAETPASSPPEGAGPTHVMPNGTTMPGAQHEEAPAPASAPRTLKRYMQDPFRFRSIDPRQFFPVYRTFDLADDFLYVFRFDPERLTTDLENRYGVGLGGTSSVLTGTESTVDLIEYWDDVYYVLVAQTVMEVSTVPASKTGLVARVRRALQEPTFIPTYTVLAKLEHGYDRVPFWVVQNIVDPEKDPTDGGSLSDLEDIPQLNQHLNLMRSEQAEEIVTNIHRPLIYASDDHQQEPKSLSFSAGAVYPIGIEERLEPVPYEGQPAEAWRHVEEIQQDIRTLSFLGDAGFGDFGSGTSGVAARIALTPMQRILELKLPPRIEVLRSLGSFLLRCFEQKLPKDAKLRGWVKGGVLRFQQVDLAPEDIAGQYYVDVDYGNLLPRDDQAHQQNEIYKWGSGAQSLFTTLENMGHEDPDEEIKRMKRELKDPWLNPEKWLAVQQAVAAQKQQEQEAAGPPQGQAPPGREIGPVAAPPTPRGTAPPVPGGSAFPRAPSAGGFGAGAATPFLGRGAPQFPGMPMGPGGGGPPSGY